MSTLDAEAKTVPALHVPFFGTQIPTSDLADNRAPLKRDTRAQAGAEGEEAVGVGVDMARLTVRSDARLVVDAAMVAMATITLDCSLPQLSCIGL